MWKPIPSRVLVWISKIFGIINFVHSRVVVCLIMIDKFPYEWKCTSCARCVVWSSSSTFDACTILVWTTESRRAGAGELWIRFGIICRITTKQKIRAEALPRYAKRGQKKDADPKTASRCEIQTNLNWVNLAFRPKTRYPMVYLVAKR